jgi:hypothetical protein
MSTEALAVVQQGCDPIKLNQVGIDVYLHPNYA